MDSTNDIWNTFTILKKNKNKKQDHVSALRGGKTIVKNKKTIQDETNHKNFKLDSANEAQKHKFISMDESKKIVSLRNCKKISQKQLAQKINVNISIIQKYENGKAIKDNNLYNKILRALK